MGQRKEAQFIVRIWQEPSVDSSGWRASIEHVGSGRSLATADFADLNDFVAHRLGDWTADDEFPRLLLSRPVPTRYEDDRFAG